jgi:hypothetical protein
MAGLQVPLVFGPSKHLRSHGSSHQAQVPTKPVCPAPSSLWQVHFQAWLLFRGEDTGGSYCLACYSVGRFSSPVPLPSLICYRVSRAPEVNRRGDMCPGAISLQAAFLLIKCPVSIAFCSSVIPE